MEGVNTEKSEAETVDILKKCVVVCCSVCSVLQCVAAPERADGGATH